MNPGELYTKKYKVKKSPKFPPKGDSRKETGNGATLVIAKPKQKRVAMYGLV